MFTQLTDEIGLDLNDNFLSGTPKRVVKMSLNEKFSSLDPKNKPKIALFGNIIIDITKCWLKKYYFLFKLLKI